MKLKSVRKTLIVYTIALFIAPGVRGAENYAFVGARASGMGGASAASVNDSTAQWHNPAAFGFMNQSEFSDGVDNGGLSDKTFGWEVAGVGAGYTMTEDMGRYLDILSDVDFDSFDTTTLGSAENVSSLLKLGSSLYGITGESLYADYTAGSSVQFGNFGIGIRTFGEVSAWVENLDLSNMSFSQDPATFVSDISNAADSDSGFASSGTFNTLTLDQRDSLASQFEVANNDASIEYIDFQLTELKADGTLNQDDVNNAVQLLEDIELDGNDTFEDNLTTVIGRGFNVIEIPVSYGYAPNKNLSFGVTAKGMYGSVLGTKIWVFNEDNVDEAIETASDNREDTLTFGLDAGVLYRMSNLQFALVGHNLNSPSFNGFSESVTIENNDGTELDTEIVTVPDVTIDPQVTLGVAFIPSERFMFGADFELLETGTLSNEYDVQRISFGSEVDVWLLSLRLGAYKNIAESDEDWVATAGVGMNLAGVRFDLSGALSLGDTTEFDGNDIPTVARFYAGISFDY